MTSTVPFCNKTIHSLTENRNIFLWLLQKDEKIIQFLKSHDGSEPELKKCGHCDRFFSSAVVDLS